AHSRGGCASSGEPPPAIRMPDEDGRAICERDGPLHGRYIGIKGAQRQLDGRRPKATPVQERYHPRPRRAVRPGAVHENNTGCLGHAASLLSWTGNVGVARASVLGVALNHSEELFRVLAQARRRSATYQARAPTTPGTRFIV